MALQNIRDNDEISLASLQRAQKGDTVAVVMEVEVTPASEGVQAKVENVTRLFRVSDRVGKVGRVTGGTVFTLRDIVDERQKLTVKSRGKLPKGWLYVRRVSEGTNVRAEPKVVVAKAPRQAAPKAQEGAAATSSLSDLVNSI